MKNATRFWSLALMLVLIFSMTPVSFATSYPNMPHFSDVPANAYYEEPVIWAYNNNITQGTTKTTFSPDTNCTRGQIITFLYRACGSPVIYSYPPVEDVSEGDYYYAAIEWAKEHEMFRGDSFYPNSACTRLMAVDFIWKCFGREQIDTETSFSDIARNTDAYSAVAWAISKGITSGTSATTFSPSQVCTRAQIVTFLFRGSKAGLMAAGDDKPQKNGFNQQTNQTIFLEGIRFSLPNYWSKRDEEKDASYCVWNAEISNKKLADFMVMVIPTPGLVVGNDLLQIVCDDLSEDLLSKNKDAEANERLELTFNLGVTGTLLSFRSTISKIPCDIREFVFYAAGGVWVFEMIETNTTSYAYDGDFAKILASISVVDSTAGLSVGNSEAPGTSANSGTGSSGASGKSAPSSGTGSSENSGTSVTVPRPETQGYLVWVPTNGGTKYHRYSGCSNMVNPIQVSIETAQRNGYTACKRCF